MGRRGRSAHARGVTPDEFAAQTAEHVGEGARRVGPGRRPHPAAARRRRLRDLHARQRRRPAGLDPAARSAPPPRRAVDDADALRERVAADRLEPARPARHRRRSDAEPRAHPALDHPRRPPGRPAQTLDLPALIQQIQKPPFDNASASLDLETFFPAKDRFALAMQLNNLLASPGFDALAGGRAARRRSACCTRPRASRGIAIFSIAHLDDAERMFFVTLLLEPDAGLDARASPARAACARSSTWTRSSATSRRSRIRRRSAAADAAQAGARVRPRRRAGDAEPGGPRLQGARRTPAPGSSAGCRPSATRRACSTGWKAPAASAVAFDRGQMEQMLAGARQARVPDAQRPRGRAGRVRDRWALSYLRGPLTREQIQTLMDGRAPAAAAAARRRPRPAVGGPRSDCAGRGPVAPALPPDVPRWTVPPASISYSRQGRRDASYSDRWCLASRTSGSADPKSGVDVTRKATAVTAINERSDRRSTGTARSTPGVAAGDLGSAPEGDASYGEVPRRGARRSAPTRRGRGTSATGCTGRRR